MDDERVGVTAASFAPPTREDVMAAARQFDEWVDKLTDRMLDELDYTAQEDYRIDNLMRSHEEIARMAFATIDNERGPRQ